MGTVMRLNLRTGRAAQALNFLKLNPRGVVAGAGARRQRHHRIQYHHGIRGRPHFPDTQAFDGPSRPQAKPQSEICLQRLDTTLHLHIATISRRQLRFREPAPRCS